MILLSILRKLAKYLTHNNNTVYITKIFLKYLKRIFTADKIIIQFISDQYIKFSATAHQFLS